MHRCNLHRTRNARIRTLSSFATCATLPCIRSATAFRTFRRVRGCVADVSSRPRSQSSARSVPTRAMELSSRSIDLLAMRALLSIVQHSIDCFRLPMASGRTCYALSGCPKCTSPTLSFWSRSKAWLTSLQHVTSSSALCARSAAPAHVSNATRYEQHSSV